MSSRVSIHNPFAERCLYCGQPAGVVWVHGHGQCASCGTNVDECCRGENLVFPASENRTDTSNRETP